MKTHLFRPGEQLTMRGIQVKSFSTTDPQKVDCQKCYGMYAVNVLWYWTQFSKSAGDEGTLSAHTQEDVGRDVGEKPQA